MQAINQAQQIRWERDSEIFPFGMMRLQPVGAFFQETRPDEEKRLKLLEYQQEMRAFTAFLKEQFLKG